ncbi:MAG: HD domain-containing protein [Deltaproteobacteria bacterium]|nr:HD domain-containing protein [Deltaproteobacteria bacterium]
MLFEKTRLFNDLIRILSLTMDFDEGEKLSHSFRVGFLCHEISGYIENLSAPEMYHAGLLHDIGGIELSNHILHYMRAGNLVHEIFMHSITGADILKPLKFFKDIIEFIEKHHEHYNGTGHPRKLSGSEVPDGAGLILLADLIDIHIRTYSNPNLKIFIQSLSGKEVSPEIARAGLNYLNDHPALVENLTDQKWLENKVFEINAVPASISDFSVVEILIQLLWVLARIIDHKHSYTMGHSVRVTWYAWQIASKLGENTVNRWDVLWAGLLHDVGKVGVPRALLNKTGPLDKTEWLIVKKHAQDTINMLSSITHLKHLAYSAAAHHEFYNGMGYPYGNSGENIPLIGRILALADSWDAMRTDRSYRRGLDFEEAVRRIEKGRGTQYDPALVDIAIDVFHESRLSDKKNLQTLEGFRQFFRFDEADIEHILNAAPNPTKILSGGDGIFLVDSVGKDKSADDSDSVKYESVSMETLGTLSFFYKNFLTSGEAVIFTDSDAIIIDANHSFLKLFKYEIDELKGLRPDIFSSSETPDEIYEEMWKNLNDPASGSWTGEVVDQTSDGKKLNIQLTISGVKNASGKLLGYMGQFKDITERIQNQILLRLQAEQLKEKASELEKLSNFKSDMMAIVRHDLKAPFNAIMSVASGIKNTHGITSEADRKLDRVIELSQRGLNLLKVMLELEKIENGKMELELKPGILRDIVTDILSVFEMETAKKKLIISIDTADYIYPLYLDIEKTAQVLSNLLSNAIKFTPENGRITILIKTGEDGVSISVENEGPQIPVNDLPSIFKKYFQSFSLAQKFSSKSGSGLGLYIVREIVNLSGGSINVENTSDGVRFTVFYPDRLMIKNFAVLNNLDSLTLKFFERQLSLRNFPYFIFSEKSPVIPSSLLVTAGDSNIPESYIHDFSHVIRVFNEQPGHNDFEDFLVTPLLESEVAVSIMRFLKNLKANIPLSHNPDTI